MTGDRAFAIDGAAVAIVAAAACVAAKHPQVMLAVVLAAMVVRTVLCAEGPRSLAREVAVLAALTAIGGFNDWNTVVGHAVYAYTVPTDLGWSSIPAWMLVYWGLILRFLVALVTWRGLPARAPRPVRVVVGLLLVLATRQAIYRLSEHPLWSWLPFLAALVVWIACFGCDRRDRRLIVIVAVAGPATEALLIGVAGLHRYRLGWLGGVPLWIALWWILAALILAELPWSSVLGGVRTVRAGSASVGCRSSSRGRR